MITPLREAAPVRPRDPDPRTIRTRSQLIQAALQLLRARDIDAISITDLAAAAGVSRPTFYLHYGSCDELLADAVRQNLQDLLAPDQLAPDQPSREIGDAGYPRRAAEQADRAGDTRDAVPASLISLLDRLNSDRELYAKLLCSDTSLGQCRYEFVQHLARQFARLTEPAPRAGRSLDPVALTAPVVAPASPPRTARPSAGAESRACAVVPYGDPALFLAGGTMAVLSVWMKRPGVASREQIDELAASLWRMISAVAASATDAG